MVSPARNNIPAPAPRAFFLLSRKAFNSHPSSFRSPTTKYGFSRSLDKLAALERE
jgi:hypothetical protein